MKKLLRICIFLLTAGWMLLIFGFSSQTGEESGGVSAIIAKPVTQLLSRLSAPMSAEAEAALYLQVDGAVRAAAHFSEYAILGALLLLVFRCIKVRNLWLPWLTGTLYALTDEWHQSFSPGRVCDMTDVFIDACGVLCGMLTCMIFIHRWRRKHVHHS